jgi:hypothetical protein
VRAADGPRAAPFGFTRIVFLSHVITAGGPTFPGDPLVEIRPAATIERDGYHLQSLVAGEQAGTHWAAPAHFALGISRVGNRPGCGHVVRRQPAAAPRASHPPGEPGRPG